jgi:hypothetical protein
MWRRTPGRHVATVKGNHYRRGRFYHGPFISDANALRLTIGAILPAREYGPDPSSPIPNSPLTRLGSPSDQVGMIAFPQ